MLYLEGLRGSGRVAERSKAMDLGSSLSGGVGSNPIAAIIRMTKGSWHHPDPGFGITHLLQMHSCTVQ